ncbi:trypco2 family protein [Shumkonia mesophila]|uniref:trypco2 family protein n=1 Tax=Shumkonia mesophila TaxID=2838854 RepID=UPI0029345FEB|nr:trypco2 family protein [Shumkonia mesophila]
MITLKEFVKDTLTQIVDAAGEFSSDRGSVGGTTNPQVETVKTENWSENGLLFCRFNGKQAIYATVIEFDVALAVEETRTKKGEGGIKVSVLNAGGGLEDRRNSSSSNRIRFKLPLEIFGDQTALMG